MVANRQRTAAERVEHLAEWAGPDAQQTRLAEQAIQEDRTADIAVSILADHPDPCPDRRRGVADQGAGVVELADEASHVAPRRPESLGVVIKVR